MAEHGVHVHGPHDHAVEHAARHGGLGQQIAIFTAILATVGAIVSFLGGAHPEQRAALQERGGAQARRGLGPVELLPGEEHEAEPRRGRRRRSAPDPAKAESYRREAQRYADEKKDIESGRASPEAKADSSSTRRASTRCTRTTSWPISMTLLQIAIALASITVLTQKRWLLAGAGAERLRRRRPGHRRLDLKRRRMLEVRGLAKSFGAGAAALRRRSSLDGRARRVGRRSWASRARASPRCSTSSRASTGPDRGEVRLDGTRARLRATTTRSRSGGGAHVGFVFQAFHLLPYLSVARERGAAAGAARRGRAPSASARARERSTPWGSRRLGARTPGLALGRRDAARGHRARAGAPPAPAARRRAHRQPRRGATPRRCSTASRDAVKRAGAAALMVTHSPVAAARADRVLRLARGRLAGSPAVNAVTGPVAMLLRGALARPTAGASRSPSPCIALGVALAGAVHTRAHLGAGRDRPRRARARRHGGRRDPRPAQRLRRRALRGRSRAARKCSAASPVLELEAALAGGRRRIAARARHRRVSRRCACSRRSSPGARATRLGKPRRCSIRTRAWLSPAAAARLQLHGGRYARAARGERRGRLRRRGRAAGPAIGRRGRGDRHRRGAGALRRAWAASRASTCGCARASMRARFRAALAPLLPAGRGGDAAGLDRRARRGDHARLSREPRRAGARGARHRRVPRLLHAGAAGRAPAPGIRAAARARRHARAGSPALLALEGAALGARRRRDRAPRSASSRSRALLERFGADLGAGLLQRRERRVRPGSAARSPPSPSLGVGDVDRAARCGSRAR